MKTLKHWLSAIASATLVLGIAACDNDATTSENGGTGSTTSAGEAVVTGDFTGTYTFDVEVLREQARQSMEVELEGATEEERRRAESRMAMSEQILAEYESWRLEIKVGNNFSMSQSETEQVEGTWSMEGNQLTLTTVRRLDGEDWDAVDGNAAERMTLTWDSSTQTLSWPMGEGAQVHLIFSKDD